MHQVIQSAVNVSTSAKDVIQGLASVISGVEGVELADYSFDVDHNRSVFTLLGEGKALQKAILKIYKVALRYINIKEHRGEHPRIGAVDVVPFTPWKNSTMQECCFLAWELGKKVFESFKVPVYFYGEAARVPWHKDLSFLRKGGWERLEKAIKEDPRLLPDIGFPALHPTMGATVIGAREPLIAFNVNLDCREVKVARAIASRIRKKVGGLGFVKAIGVELRSRGMVQVSCNILDYRKNPVYQVFEVIKLEARRYGVSVKETEIIGLVPLEAIVEIFSYYLKQPGFSVRQVLETHLV